MAIGASLAELIVAVIEQMEIVATARTQASREAYDVVFKALELLLKDAAPLLFPAIDLFMNQLGTFYDALDLTNFPEKVEEFYNGLRNIVQQMSGFNWGNLSASNAGLLVNIWGSEDPLAKLGISGYRDEMGEYTTTDRDYPLFNIEIIGANHFDYVRGFQDFEEDYPDLAERQAAIDRNIIISGYVTRLILNAQDPISFQSHLNLLVQQGVLFKTGDNTYELRVLG